MLSTPEVTAFNVTITNAAGTVNQTVSLSQSTPKKINLRASPYGTLGFGGLGILADGDLNEVNDKDGLILTADRRFYAGIRHAQPAQAGSLTAKGRSALGTEFRSGHMNALDTANTQDGIRNHFISVMATEDGTTVEFDDISPGIVFRNGAGGIMAGNPAPVALDRGESYVLGVDLTNIAAPNHNDLNGTLITSDRPIVVNSGSWLTGNGAGQDAGFDQILPVELQGTDFILAKGKATTLRRDLETPFVVAISDNTQIFLNGALTPAATINAGDYFEISGLSYYPDTMVIRTSQPAYVYQTTAGANSSANVGLNAIVPISDAIEPQTVVIPFANQLGAVTINIIAPAAATATLNGTPLTSGTGVPGTTFTRYTQNVTGQVIIDSAEAVFVSMTTRNSWATSAAYYSGVPNTLAVDDAALTASGTAVVIDVQDNDIASSATFDVISATDPPNGSVAINPDGTITYTPDAGFVGEDEFSYTISDGVQSDTATGQADESGSNTKEDRKGRRK